MSSSRRSFLELLALAGGGIGMEMIAGPPATAGGTDAAQKNPPHNNL